MSHEILSGFLERGVDLWQGMGNFWGSPRNFRRSLGNSREQKLLREVLHGVGADGVGVKSPFFAVNFAVVCLCSLGEEEKSEEKRRKAKKKAKKCKKKKTKSA